MKFHLYKNSLPALLIAFLSLISACTDSDKLTSSHLEKAKAFIEIENFEKARIELKNVLQLNPKTAQAYYLLGKVEEQRNEWPSAISNYLKAIELDPTIVEAQIRLAQYHLSLAKKHRAQKEDEEATKNINIAQKKTDDILKTQPASAEGRVLQASILNLNEKTNEAIGILETILSENPASYEAVLLLSQIYEERNNYSKAEMVLTTGVQHFPDKHLLHYRLAKFYEKHSHLGKAIKIMEKLSAKHPGTFKYTALLGYYYEITNQTEKTEKLLRSAIKINPAELSRHNILSQFIEKHKGINAAINVIEHSIKQYPDLIRLRFTLATLHLNNKDIDKAIIQLKTIIDNQKYTPEDIEARKKLTSIYLDSRQLEQAQAHISYLLDDNPRDNDTLILNAKLSFIKQDYQTAITSLRTVLKLRPDDIKILRQLAESYIKNREPELAEEVFRKITYLQPESIKTKLDNIRFNIASSKITEALKEIDALLANHPDNLDIIKLKTDALLSAGHVNDAIPFINTIKKLAPDDAEGWFRMGRIYKILKKPELAIHEFETAWNKSSNSDTLLAELIDLEISSGKSVQARNRLKQILTTQPAHPSAHKFIAMTYLSEKSFDKAKNEFEKQLKQQPVDPASYQQLAKIELLKRKPENAANYYLNGLKHSPDNQQLRMGLASTYEQLQQYDNAIKTYQEVLASNPKNIVATNNLAMILVSKKTDKQSYTLAEKLVANFKSSNQAVLLDTYGWVHYHNGNYQQTITALNKAVSLAPEVPVYYYHLGMAHNKTGNTQLAKTNLQAAFNKGRFPGMEIAKHTLDSIK